MNNRHIQFFGKNLQAHTVCGKTFFSMDVDTFEPPFEVVHFQGEHNLEGCQGCRNSMEKMKIGMNDYFKIFPNCCDSHQNLLKQDWFDLNKYSDLGDKVAYKVIYMHHHTINNIKRDDWYIEITSYLEYVFESFGQFPSDCGAPAGISQAKSYLLELLKNADLENNEMNPRKEQIIEFVLKYREIEDEKNTNRTDINLLISIYEKWMKIFPFELELFSDQKERFENSFPLLHGEVVENKYTGLAKVKMINQPVLLDYLNTITKKVLYAVDTSKLLEEGKITNSQKYQLDIARSKYKLNHDKNKNQFDLLENDYVKSIEEWLKNEVEYIQTVNSINLPKLEAKQVKDDKKIEDSFTLNAAQTSDDSIKELFEKLVNLNCVKLESKADFVKAFRNKIPVNKIDWIGDLRSFISLLKSENKIKNVGNRHWSIAVKLFLRNGNSFDNKTISDTKPTKNHTKILKIVQSITK